MRPDCCRLGILAVGALLAVPWAPLAQTTTSTDAAIAELRQLLADQRAALDRQAQIIEEQGRTLAALQQRVEGTNRAEERRSLTAGAGAAAAAASSGSSPAAGQPYGRRAAAGSASGGRVGRRFPGFDPHSRDRVGLQTGRPGANGRGPHAERARHRRSVRDLLDSGRGPESGRGSAHGLLPHREPLEHRAAHAECERADAPVHRKRLRRRRPGDEAAARVPPDESLRRRPDVVHVL